VTACQRAPKTGFFPFVGARALSVYKWGIG